MQLYNDLSRKHKLYFLGLPTSHNPQRASTLVHKLFFVFTPDIEISPHLDQLFSVNLFIQINVPLITG